MALPMRAKSESFKSSSTVFHTYTTLCYSLGGTGNLKNMGYAMHGGTHLHSKLLGAEAGDSVQGHPVLEKNNMLGVLVQADL